MSEVANAFRCLKWSKTTVPMISIQYCNAFYEIK